MTTTTDTRTDEHTPRAQDETHPKTPAGRGRHTTLSVRASTLAFASIIVALLVVATVLGGLLWSATRDLANKEAAADDDKHAVQVATDYAVGASKIDFQDVNAWLAKLKANTAPQLGNKFDATAPKLQEILVPLQWTSTGAPIGGIVASEAGGIYKVNVFLNVTSTSAQTPNGAQTTVTYNVTIDKNSNWQITDVGGMDGALPVK